jgi:hypothetical protein
MSDKHKRRAPKRNKQPAQSQATQRPVGSNQHSEGVHNKSDGVNTHPHGNNATYAERRLRERQSISKWTQNKDRPDLYALRQLLRSDRKRTGGWVRLGKLKGAYA